MNEADSTARTETLIQSLDALLTAPIPKEEKEVLLNEAISRIVFSYKGAAENRAELDTGREEVYSKKNRTNELGYL